MHRSGTSATTGALQILGVDLGDRLAAGHAGINDLGYFEHVAILDHHDALLADLGSRWDDVLPLPEGWWETEAAKRHGAAILATLKHDFAAAPFWGVKDPRMCRLVPAWLPLFQRLDARLFFLIVLRRPEEVAGSLARRDKMDEEKAHQLWLEHTLAAERWSRGQPRAFITYDALLADPVATAEAASAALGLAWPVAPAEARARLEEFLSADLRHEQREGPPPGPDRPAAALAFEVWTALAGAGIAGPDNATLDALQSRHTARIAAFDPALVAHLRNQSAGRIEAERTVAGIYGSLSWKLAKPIRMVLG